MFNEQQLALIQTMIDNALRKQQRPKIIQSDITNGTIKRRHLEDVVIVFGTDDDRPTDDTTGIKAHFAQDSGTLSLWDGTQWLETTLS